jgi:hypothetical protein
MFTRTLAIASTLLLGGCALSGLLPDWTSTDVAGPEPAYKFLIANKLKEVLGDAAPSDTLEISKAERLESLKGASWRVCVKAQKFLLPPRYYAVFFQRDQLVDSRLSVLIDQCEIQSYAAFDWKAEANNPPPAR